jgi:hypothetical protein
VLFDEDREMTAAQRTLIIITHAPALMEHDDRPIAVVHAMERALPGLRLGWTLSEKGDLIALPHRDEWMVANMKDGGFPFLCNDDDTTAAMSLTFRPTGCPCSSSHGIAPCPRFRISSGG